MNDDASLRRIVGLVLGVVLGMIYGVITQFINLFFLPDIQFYQPPLGAYGNALVWMSVGAALGFLASLPKESVHGAFLGGISGAIALTILTLLTGRTDTEIWGEKILAMLFLIIPLIGAMTLIAGIHRWVVNRVVQARIDRESLWALVHRPVLLAIIVAAVGIRALLPDFARTMLTRMDNLLRAGLQAEEVSDLPPALQGRLVGPFVEKAEAPYSLQWENRNINRFVIPRPLTDRPWEESAIIARFKNGWILVCLFAKSDAEPSCKGFDQWIPSPSS